MNDGWSGWRGMWGRRAGGCGEVDGRGRDVGSRRATEPPLDLHGVEGILQVVLVHEVRANDPSLVPSLELRAVVPREPLRGEPLHLPWGSPVARRVTSPDVHREQRRLVLGSPSRLSRPRVLDRAKREHAVEEPRTPGRPGRPGCRVRGRGEDHAHQRAAVEVQEQRGAQG